MYRTIPKIKGYTKIQVISFVKMKIASNENWAKRACLALYNQQTKKEKRNHISSGHNQWGFDRNNSPLLSHIAGKLKQNRATLNDVSILQSKLPKYSKQLINLSYEKDKCKLLKKHLDYYYKNNQSQLPY